MRLLIGDPRGLWLVLAAALFLLVLARRGRARVVPLTTYFLLRRITERLPVLSRRVRLLRRLARALAAAGALAAACAALRPTLVSEAPPLRELAILDLSPSLGVRGADGQPRLALLKREVGAFLELLRPEDTLVLVAAGTHPVAVTPADPAAARRWLDALDPGESAADPLRAARLAAALDRRGGFDHVLVFSDRPARWAAASAVDGFAPRFVTFGGPSPNAGIDRFDLQPDPLRPGIWRLFARLSCAGVPSGAAATPLAVEVRNNREAPIRLERACAPDSPAEIDLPGLELEPGTVEVRLDPGDAYPADDRVVAGVAAPAPAPVYLVGEGNRYLQAALGADSGLSFEVLAPGQPLPRAPRAVFIFDGPLPEGPLPERALFIRPDRALASLTPRSYGSYPDRVSAEREDPLMRAVELEGVALRDYVEFLPEPRFREAASADGRPLVLSLAEEGRRWVVFGFDPSETALVHAAAYPLLIANAVRWLSLFSPAERPVLRAGERVALPAEACGGRVLTPAGARVALPADCSAGLAFEGALHPGSYRVEGRSGEPLGEFHVALLDPSVSAEIGAPGYGVGGEPLPPGLARGPQRVDLTPWLALVALGCLAASRLIVPPGASARL